MVEIVFWIFIYAAGVHLLFNLLVLIALAFYKVPSKKGASKEGVSVIVCAKNEAKNLKKLIPQLLAQKYEKYEIILVDDKSTDETYDYAINLDHKVENFRLVRIDSTPDHINNKKYAIILGVRAANYDQLLFTDADCLATGENWISEMSRGYFSDKKQFVIGYSQYKKGKGLLNIFIRYETLLTALNYIGIGLLGNPYMAVGRNIGYRKSLFLEKNGFGKFQNVVGGDDDLFVNQYARRRSTSFVLSRNATIFSNPKTKLSDFIIQKTRHLSVGKHYRKTDKLLLGLLASSKIIFWITFIAAILAEIQTYFVLGGFFAVMVSLLTVLLIIKYKTGDRSRIWMLPLLDFIFIFYYISTGLKVLFTKKVKWK